LIKQHGEIMNTFLQFLFSLVGVICGSFITLFFLSLLTGVVTWIVSTLIIAVITGLICFVLMKMILKLDEKKGF